MPLLTEEIVQTISRKEAKSNSLKCMILFVRKHGKGYTLESVAKLGKFWRGVEK